MAEADSPASAVLLLGRPGRAGCGPFPGHHLRPGRLDPRHSGLVTPSETWAVFCCTFACTAPSPGHTGSPSPWPFATLWPPANAGSPGIILAHFLFLA